MTGSEGVVRVDGYVFTIKRIYLAEGALQIESTHTFTESGSLDLRKRRIYAPDGTCLYALLNQPPEFVSFSGTPESPATLSFTLTLSLNEVRGESQGFEPQPAAQVGVLRRLWAWVRRLFVRT